MKRIELIGAQRLYDLMVRGGTVGVDVLVETLRNESLLAFRDSQRRVPHADGILRASGVVKPPEVSGTHVDVQMGYGGAASAYALYQHENLSLRHPDPTNPKSSPKGEAKYLENPVRDQSRGLAGRLRKQLESRLKK